jgi:hypothetical protein
MKQMVNETKLQNSMKKQHRIDFGSSSKVESYITLNEEKPVHNILAKKPTSRNSSIQRMPGSLKKKLSSTL